MTSIALFGIGLVAGFFLGWLVGIGALRELARGDNWESKEWSKRPRKTVG